MKDFFSCAFRPFFAATACYAIVAVALWVWVLQGAAPVTLPVNVTYWHAHEMLVGFAFGALAGFLLTAVATWTGRPPVSGWLLAVLWVTWLAGRVAMGWGGVLEPRLTALLDSVFPLLLAGLVVHEVGTARNSRNLPVAALVCWLALANLLYHAGATGLLPLAVDAERVGLLLMLHGMLLMLTLIAGRIIPAFSGNWLRARGHAPLPAANSRTDRATLALTGLCGLYAAIAPFSGVTGTLALLAAVLHAMRLWRWRGWRVRSEPLLVMLHIAYAWLPPGYLLLAATAFGWSMSGVAAIHALAVGALGTMVLALVTRVPLGHTGRPLTAGFTVSVAYALMLAAAVLRVYGGSGAAYYPVLNAAACAWVASFTVYLGKYLPILLQGNPAAEASPPAGQPPV